MNELTTRVWRSAPDGSNDIAVDIWFNTNWIPAYFSDIKKGDFYLILKTNLDPDRCFCAGSDVIRFGKSVRSYDQSPTFVISKGSQIVQAPNNKEIELNQIGNNNAKTLR